MLLTHSSWDNGQWGPRATHRRTRHRTMKSVDLTRLPAAPGRVGNPRGLPGQQQRENKQRQPHNTGTEPCGRAEEKACTSSDLGANRMKAFGCTTRIDGCGFPFGNRLAARIKVLRSFRSRESSRDGRGRNSGHPAHEQARLSGRSGVGRRMTAGRRNRKLDYGRIGNGIFPDRGEAYLAGRCRGPRSWRIRAGGRHAGVSVFTTQRGGEPPIRRPASSHLQSVEVPLGAPKRQVGQLCTPGSCLAAFC